MRRSYIKENGDRYIDDHPTKEDALDLVDKNKGKGYIVEVGNFLHSDCINEYNRTQQKIQGKKEKRNRKEEIRF